MAGDEELEQPLLAEGWIDDDVREEFPELRLRTMAVDRGTGRTPPEVRERLRLLSNRFRGAQAIVMRRAPIPSAYRVFFRHVGLDPDTTRTPAEEAAMQRLIRGGFRATNHLDDALLIALLETGVPLWAVDAARVREPLGIGTASDGRLAVFDADGPLAPLFGELPRDRVVAKETTRTLVYTVQVPGVPAIFVEEAMWTCLGVLQADD
jgi:hypothetical protein